MLPILSVTLSLEWQEDSQLFFIISRLNPKLTPTKMTRMTLVASQADAKRCQTGSRLGVVQLCTFTAGKKSLSAVFTVQCCIVVQCSERVQFQVVLVAQVDQLSVVVLCYVVVEC